MEPINNKSCKKEGGVRMYKLVLPLIYEPVSIIDNIRDAAALYKGPLYSTDYDETV